VKVVVGAATDIGRHRERNEDAYLRDDPLFAVADGMGGHRGGEVASKLALETLEHTFRHGGGGLADQVREANRAVFERSLLDRAVAGMGTTLTAAVVEGDQVRLAHVGDSRAYLLRAGELKLLTEDHTLVHQMVEQGEITEAEAEVHPYRSILTRALGVDPQVQVDEGLVDVRKGDRILLCTDGLTGMLTEEQVREILQGAGHPQDAADRLVRAANRAGGIDNITAVVLDLAPEEGESRDVEGPETALPDGGSPRRSAPRPTPSTPPPARPKRRSRLSPGRLAAAVGIPVAVVVLGVVGLRVYLDSQWYVGVSNGHVAVFRGIPVEVAGFRLHHLVAETTLPATLAESLALYRDLPDGITADGREGADAIVDQIRADLERLPASPTP